MRSSALLLPLLAGCSACVPSREPPPVAPSPPVTVAPPPAPAPVGKWEDWPVTPGDWSYRRDDRGSTALYGAPGATARFTLRCDQAQGRILLSRAGAGGDRMTVRTSSTTRALPATATAAPAGVAAELASTDPLVDALGFSRGRFVVETPGQPPLVLPAWAEVLRVAEDCR